MTLAPKATAAITDALAVINSSPHKIALVLDEEMKLLGTITDGDVRRALLKHVSLDARATNIMNTDPAVATIPYSKQNILSLLQRQKLLAIPILDTNSRVIGIEGINDLTEKSKIDVPVVIMAGGLGARLRPLTEDCPKPMLKINDKPLLEIIIDNLIESGFYNFYVSVNYKSEIIRDYFENGEKWGVSIQYLVENNILGTAGSLGLIPEVKQHDFYIVINGDILTKVNYEFLINYHRKNQSNVTLCVRKYQQQVPYGVVNVKQGQLLSITEKPIQEYFVSAGVYIINSDIISFIPQNHYLDMPNLFMQLLDKNIETTVFPIHEYWIDIGQVNDFKQANIDYKQLFNE